MAQQVNFDPITQQDLDDPTLSRLNQFFQQIVNQLNQNIGATGNAQMLGDLDMAGHRIKNLGTAQDEADALNQTAADPLYSTQQQQDQMNALGKFVVQTNRRLNDGTQQHRISSDLNSQGSIPPSNVTGTLTYTTTAGVITATWTSIIVQLADLSYKSVPDGSLQITGLSSTTAYDLYGYLDTNTGLFTFVADNTNAVGTPPVAFPTSPASGLTIAAQAQTADGRIPLTLPSPVTPNGSTVGGILRTR